MEPERKHCACPVEHAGALDHPWRRLYENPKRILRSHVDVGMSVLDFGCGPGFFTLEMTRLVGESGRVVAVDLQQGMLDKALRKLADAGLADRVAFHVCRADAIGLKETFDFILVFHVLHETPDQESFLRELKTTLKPGGRALLAEPNFHVSKDDFKKSILIMKKVGLEVEPGPKLLFSRAVLLRNPD